MGKKLPRLWQNGMARRIELSEEQKFPRHVAIILDGNGRWAERQGRERTFGHQAGADNVKTIVREAGHMGIERLTIYAFSTENWKRPQPEVDFLMELFKDYLLRQLRDLMQDGVQLHVVGERSRLSEGLRKEVEACEADTRNNTGLVLNVAINYGGRDEIVRAARLLAEDVQAGRLASADITEDALQRRLYESDAADVDLLIRTGGESRISNFLLWQISYSELYFTPVLWPDFTVEELHRAVDWFCHRDRRFGGLNEGEAR